MPEAETHVEAMRKKIQDTTKSITEIVQELLEDGRQQGILPAPQ